MTLLLDASQAAAGDEAAVAAGDTWAGLMARAAGHLTRGVVRAAGRQAGLRVVLVVGKGNNGGDGWAAARRLHDLGSACTVASVVPTDVEVSDEAGAHRSAWLASGGRVVVGPEEVARVVDGPDVDVVVDCLLGTGISGAPRGDVGRACAAINTARDTHRTLVVACDVPSGVASDTGAAPGDAVRADATVTLGGMKRGLALHPGTAHAGRVTVGSLGARFAPPEQGDDGITWRLVGAGDGAPEGVGDVAADKRSRGSVMVVAGSVGAAGAAILATRGALWSGAGLTTLATPAHVQRVIAPVVPSAMTLPLRHVGQHVGPDAVDQLDLSGIDAVAAGPGLGPTDGTRAVVDHLRAHAPRLVLDADAINVYRDDPDTLADHGGALVLTPHERELARIGGGDDGRDAWAHRVERVPQLAERFGAVIVAKGPRTIVAGPHGACWVVPVGGPELGTGGTGDVLAGVVAAAITSVPVDDPAALTAAVARAVFWEGFTGAWLAAGRPDPATLVRSFAPLEPPNLRSNPGPDTLVRRFAPLDPPNLRSNADGGVLGAPTRAGFGPSSALPEVLPEAARVLQEVADRQPDWPLGVPW